MGFESSTRRRSCPLFTAAFASTLLLLIIGISTVSDHGLMKFTPVSAKKRGINSATQKNTLSATHRKLLINGPRQEAKEKEVKPNRIWGNTCSKSDIVITQGPTAPLPNGIPTYTVEIMNACTVGCDISRIHITCGWFSSARLIDPHLFKRLRFNDCLVNHGAPLPYGHTISFQYANTFPYPLDVSSVTC